MVPQKDIELVVAIANEQGAIVLEILGWHEEAPPGVRIGCRDAIALWEVRALVAGSTLLGDPYDREWSGTGDMLPTGRECRPYQPCPEASQFVSGPRGPGTSADVRA